MYEIYNNLAKVQDTRKKTSKKERKLESNMNNLWFELNRDRFNLVNVFGGSFRIREQKAA